MEFKQFEKMFQENFSKMTKESTKLFEVSLDKDVIWNLYLDSFPEGTNPIYIARREFDCSCCRHFVKNFGSVVTIENNNLKTVWDFETGDSTYQPVINALSKFVKNHLISDVYFTKTEHIGTDKNFETSDSGIIEWNHFYLKLPNRFVDTSGKSEGDFKGFYRDIRNVFKRSLDEITEESVMTVLELISQNSLYKGEEWKSALTEFLKLKKEYSKLKTVSESENYAWSKSLVVGGVVGKIKNHSIGVLLSNISEGMDLDIAVKKYESIVAPANYKRPQAIFTKKMLEDAKKTIEELGFLDSLNRRYATLDDITVNNILFSNKDSAKRISGKTVFDDILGDISSKSKKFSKVEEISVEDFVKNVLPLTSDLEVYLENKNCQNFVSLIAPDNKLAPTMFKWNNPYSWAYSGNMTDSDIKTNVKSAGGNVEGVLRFSIQWNDSNKHDQNDLDAHCIEPRGNEIFYGNKVNRSTHGELDVDITNPMLGKPAVENITWANESKMEEGKYVFFVQNYSNRGGRDGFKAEIEFNGQIYSFEYNKELRQKEEIQVAEVTYKRGIGFTIKETLPSTLSSKEVWNLKTNEFVPVSVVMFSPNYWDEQNGIGHKHYFFMLKDCVNPENPNSLFNEFLKEDLMNHRKVFEAIGAKMAVKDADDQLSGLGFSSTKRNDLTVKVKGQSERIIKIKF